MAEIIKFYPKAAFDNLDELGIDSKKAIDQLREIESVWDLPIEERQAAYEALKLKYDISMMGPGITDDD
jgi:hypothetical protein